jgi:excisionase family DNA binding protein
MRADATNTDHGSPDEPDFRTVKEAARYLRLCEKQVRRLISRGDLQAYQFGTALRIKRRDIESYARVNRIGASSNKQYRRTSS